jgi:hypothetical protein
MNAARPDGRWWILQHLQLRIAIGACCGGGYGRWRVCKIGYLYSCAFWHIIVSS